MKKKYFLSYYNFYEEYKNYFAIIKIKSLMKLFLQFFSK